MAHVTKLQWSNLNEKIGQLEKFEAIARPVFTDAMQDVVGQVSESARENAPKFSGELAGSITGRVTQVSGLNIEGVVGSDVESAMPMEYGTRPHFPPVAALLPWTNGDEAGAWGMARLIAAGGLFKRKYLSRAAAQNRRYQYNRLNQAVKELTEMFK